MLARISEHLVVLLIGPWVTGAVAQPRPAEAQSSWCREQVLGTQRIPTWRAFGSPRLEMIGNRRQSSRKGIVLRSRRSQLQHISGSPANIN